MLTVDRHLLISCAPRYVGSSKQLRSVKNTEKQDVANPAVVAEMVEAHVCILHFQLLDKHFFKGFLLETGLGRQTLQSLPSSLAPPLFVAWLLSSWLQSDSSSRSCIAYTFSLPQLRCSHKMSRLTSMSGSLLWGICAPNTIDISRQARRIFHSMSPEMQVSKSCPGNTGGYAGLDGKSHLKFWLGSA